MDQPSWLVTSVSEMGSTAEIAEVVAERLRAAGLEVDVVPTREVRSLELLGSAVTSRAGSARRSLPPPIRDQALPSSGVAVPERAPRPVGRAAGDPAGPTGRGARREIRVRGHATFGGRIDPGRAEGFLARSMARGGMRDFRDFEQIRAWADRIADDLGPRSTAA